MVGLALIAEVEARRTARSKNDINIVARRSIPGIWPSIKGFAEIVPPHLPDKPARRNNL